MSHENGESKFSHLVKDRQKINPYQNGQKISHPIKFIE